MTIFASAIGRKTSSLIGHLRAAYNCGDNLPGRKQFDGQVQRLENILRPTCFRETLPIVESAGTELGYQAPRWFVHLTGLRHLVSRVILIGDAGLLLQRRSGDRFGVKGTVDLTAGGHVLTGETPLESAYREMQEEIGIGRESLIGGELRRIGRPYFVSSAKPDDYTLNKEITVLFGGRLLNGSTKFSCQRTEVEELFFSSLEQAQGFIDRQLAASSLRYSLPILESLRFDVHFPNRPNDR
ncbi:MAG: NUDIX domain-containing protein [Candidatus Margulisiibacteriota bacterium]|jgi:8-oxo-dGTP pyrophosphatase MutT (NUDIX family)